LGNRFGKILNFYVVKVEEEDDKYIYLEVELFKKQRPINLRHFQKNKILARSRTGRRRVNLFKPEDIKYKCIFLACNHFDEICRKDVYICTRLLSHVTKMQIIPV